MQTTYYRVQNFQNMDAFLVSSTTTFSQLIDLIKKSTNLQNFHLIYHWRNLSIEKYSSITLKQIVHEDPQKRPTFYIWQACQNEELSHCYLRQKYGKDLSKNNEAIQEPKKQIWKGSNGHILFDDRNLALLASSVNYGTPLKPYHEEAPFIRDKFTNNIILPEAEKKENPSLFRRFLMKLGIISKQPKSKDIMNTIDILKKVKTKEDLKQHINREYSDFDPKFATYLQAVYVKFAILNKFKIHYVEYPNLDFGVIEQPIPKNARVGLIGDYGTGLQDSIDLMRHLVIQKHADIIIHLGDVYYAGTPHQYEENVMNILKKLRIQTKRKILFYSIPGNHDYYSWGFPFLCFLKDVNEDTFAKQSASYFCLRTEDEKWQFLGLDTAYHESNPIDQINSFALGPHLRAKEVRWAKHKLQMFKGSTILLTHHQLFSIHDRICGSMTKYHLFSCLNPLLSAQLFQYTSDLSAWFWGHEHSFMLFKEDILGVPKCRLLGNSSFHVFSEEKPYRRKEGFPFIPFIQDDKAYFQKYLPVSPNQKKAEEPLYNFCYGFIDFSKGTDSLPIEYYCCPCYEVNSSTEKNIFAPYLLYKEELLSREEIQSKRNVVKAHTQVYLKCEIGLFLSQKNSLNLSGKPIKLSKKIGNSAVICDGDTINFDVQQNQALQGSWLIQKARDEERKEIHEGEAFSFYHASKEAYLTPKIYEFSASLGLEKSKSLFMFFYSSLIKS